MVKQLFKTEFTFPHPQSKREKKKFQQSSFRGAQAISTSKTVHNWDFKSTQTYKAAIQAMTVGYLTKKANSRWENRKRSWCTVCL